jgi:hypothetical protein
VEGREGGRREEKRSVYMATTGVTQKLEHSFKMSPLKTLNLLSNLRQDISYCGY